MIGGFKGKYLCTAMVNATRALPAPGLGISNAVGDPVYDP